MKSDCDSDSWDSDSSVVEFGLIILLRSLLGPKSAESESCDPDSFSDCDSDSSEEKRIALLEGDSQNLQMMNGRFKNTSGHCFANYNLSFTKLRL